MPSQSPNGLSEAERLRVRARTLINVAVKSDLAKDTQRAEDYEHAIRATNKYITFLGNEADDQFVVSLANMRSRLSELGASQNEASPDKKPMSVPLEMSEPLAMSSLENKCIEVPESKCIEVLERKCSKMPESKYIEVPESHCIEPSTPIETTASQPETAEIERTPGRQLPLPAPAFGLCGPNPYTPSSGIPPWSTPAQKVQDDDESSLKDRLLSTIYKADDTITLDDVVGNCEAVQALIEAIEYPELFSDSMRPDLIATGILLYGPPGTGKSMLVKAAANTYRRKMFQVSTADLLSKFQGDSEKSIQSLFQLAIEQSPSIIFMDEIDAMTRNRTAMDSTSTRSYQNVLLASMTTLDDAKRHGKLVVLIGATNLPWDIDPASLRRFQRQVYVRLPDASQREELFRKELIGASLSDGDYENLAERSEGMSGDDIINICRDTERETFRLIHGATHAVPVNVDGKLLYKPVPKHLGCGYIDHTCPKENIDIEAIPCDYKKLDKSVRLVPVIQWADIYRKLSAARPTCKSDLLKKFEEFSEKK